MWERVTWRAYLVSRLTDYFSLPKDEQLRGNTPWTEYNLYWVFAVHAGLSTSFLGIFCCICSKCLCLHVWHLQATNMSISWHLLSCVLHGICNNGPAKLHGIMMVDLPDAQTIPVLVAGALIVDILRGLIICLHTIWRVQLTHPEAA